jgi:hypothetical protein
VVVQVRLRSLFLKVVVAEDEDAKLHAEAEKIGILAHAVVNTADASVLLVTGLGLGLVHAVEDNHNIWPILHLVLAKLCPDFL